MDDILNAALDDLDDDDDNDIVPLQQKSHGLDRNVQEREVRNSAEVRPDLRSDLSAVQSSVTEKPSPGNFNQDEEEKILAASLENMMAQLAKVGEEIGMVSDDEDTVVTERALDDIIKQMSGQLELLASSTPAASISSPPVSSSSGSRVEGSNSSDQKATGKHQVKVKKTGSKGKTKNVVGTPKQKETIRSPTSPADGVDGAVSRLLSDMARASAKASSSSGNEYEEVPNLDAAYFEEMGDDLMRSVVEEVEKFGKKGDTDEVLNGMMRQLLSKELMYEPMKQVCEKFPEWLAGARDKLPADDYERYGHQYQYFQRIVHVYESDPDNFPRLMELMQEIQEYGQPPADIVKELAPGLEFDEEGMPKMDGMGGVGMPPGMMFPPFPPGMPGGEGDDQCSIM